MGRKWLIPAAALAALGAGAVAWIRHAPAVHQKATPAVALPAEADLAGAVTPRNIVAVAPPEEGILDQWAVETGESVYKDQLLARIRVPRLEDAAQQAQTELENLQERTANLDSSEMAAKLEITRAGAERDRAAGEVDRLGKIYERYKSLWDLGAIARLSFEQSEKEYKNAQTAAENAGKAEKTAKDRMSAVEAAKDDLARQIAEKTRAVEQAKADLSAGDLHAPADGIVFARHGDQGQPVDPSMKDAVEIATDPTQLQVTLTPLEADLPRLHAGQAAEVSFGGEQIAGTIREIRGGEVVVDFETRAAIPKPGETAQVKIKF